MQAVGCPRCSNGYKGRVGLYEVLPLSDNIRSLVLARANSTEIEELAVEEGMDTLRQAMRRHVGDEYVTALLDLID